jgi:hypothetical protein
MRNQPSRWTRRRPLAGESIRLYRDVASLGEMLIDAFKVPPMAFLPMVPDQTWLTERDHFKSFPGDEMSPGWNVRVLSG